MNPTPKPGACPKIPLLRNLLLFMLAALVVWSLYLADEIYTFGQKDETADADVAIVLGAGIRRNGEPSPVFRERINHAVELYEQGIVGAIIFTGGVGPGNQLAGSEVARQYALENGVPPTYIFIETKSQDTLENLAEAQRMMESKSFQTALIVSDPLHMYRAMKMADDLGINAKSSPTTTSRYVSSRAIFNFLAREIFLVTGYFLFSAG